MTATDAPDWQTIVTLQTGGTVTDAPDWTDVVTGPGGIQPVTAVGASFASMWLTSGVLGLTMDPATAGGGASPVGGTIVLMAFTALATATFSNVWVPLHSGATYTVGETFAAIYDFGQASAGNFTRLAISASATAPAVWASSGCHPVAMTSGVNLTEGDVYVVGLLANGAGLSCDGVTYGTFELPPNFSSFPLRANSSASGITLPTTIAFSSCTLAQRLPLVYLS
jgi:predicted RecA/RadA family phage recombinase